MSFFTIGQDKKHKNFQSLLVSSCTITITHRVCLLLRVLEDEPLLEHILSLGRRDFVETGGAAVNALVLDGSTGCEGGGGAGLAGGDFSQRDEDRRGAMLGLRQNRILNLDI